MTTTINILLLVLCQIYVVYVEGNIFLNWYSKLFFDRMVWYLQPRTKVGPTLIPTSNYSFNDNLIKQADFNLHTLNNKELLATLRIILWRLEAKGSPLDKPDINQMFFYSKKCKRLGKGKPLTHLPNYMKCLTPYFFYVID